MNDINPFAPRGMAEHVNQGTVNIEQSRAVTEAQGKCGFHAIRTLSPR